MNAEVTTIASIVFALAALITAIGGWFAHRITATSAIRTHGLEHWDSLTARLDKALGTLGNRLAVVEEDYEQCLRKLNELTHLGSENGTS